MRFVLLWRTLSKLTVACHVWRKAWALFNAVNTLAHDLNTGFESAPPVLRRPKVADRKFVDGRSVTLPISLTEDHGELQSARAPTCILSSSFPNQIMAQYHKQRRAFASVHYHMEANIIVTVMANKTTLI